VESVDPTHKTIRANGALAFNGWAKSSQVEAKVDAWFEANTFDEKKTGARALNKAAVDEMVYAPLASFSDTKPGTRISPASGKGPPPLFWGVSKTA
jgi:peptide/nickel transport system substrate-binding protein